LEALDLGLGHFNRPRKSQIFISRNISGLPSGAIDGVAKALSAVVCLTAGTQYLQTQAALVKGVLRDTACPVELRPYAVPECHAALAVSSF
jgi:hypothetical protein